jgi:hypothetical protein
MNFDHIRKEFESKHSIDDVHVLEKYINFLLEYKLEETDTYTEKHHILPFSTFPEYKDEIWNLVELKYEDHKLVHLWLFESINIRTYQRPLNFMIPQYKDSKMTSNAAKKGWINLKNDKSKYDKWRNGRANHMRSLSSEEQSRRANIFWTNITDEQYTMFSNKMKEYWTEEKIIEKSKKMKEYYSNPENIAKKSLETQKRWDSMQKEDREKFASKMNIVNKENEKRRKAGDKIKNLWKDSDYLNKMKNRPHRKGTNIMIIKPDGQKIIVESMNDFQRIYEFSLHLIRKYRDTDIEISEKDLKKNMFLLNCKIKTITNG